MLSYLVTDFFALSRKINCVETSTENDYTEHVLTTNLACIFL